VEIAWALALAGCGFDVAGDQPMAAPDVYRTWWARTEACSGLAGDYPNNEMVVRHEMVHDLPGHSGHPNPPFGEGCPLTWATWTGGD
jgi:hypothetical protein